MRSTDDLSSLAPDARRSEVASILTAGILRLHAHMAIPGDIPPEISPDSATACLEVPSETVLSVIHGG